MIILDLNQIMISTFVMEKTDVKSGDGMARHIFFSKVLSLKKKFKEYGEIILCSDADGDYWRKDMFPYYKGDRKAMKEKSDIDWDAIHTTMRELKAELKALNIYKFIEVPKCEADDCIAVLCEWAQANRIKQVGLYEEPEPILIVSADGDFVQLQKYSNVQQWSPMHKKFVKPEGTLHEHITTHIVKASDDAIPNILSPDNSIVDKIRQKPVKKEFLQSIIEMADPEKEITDQSILRNYQRNKKLIDLSLIPQDYKDKIVACIESQTATMNRMKLFQYFVKQKMKLMVDHTQEF